MTPICAPVVRTKVGSGYTTDDGEEVGSHTLYMVDCACGSPRHRGACWYASEDHARRSYDRRVGMTTSVREYPVTNDRRAG